jgi:hypothetical protein
MVIYLYSPTFILIKKLSSKLISVHLNKLQHFITITLISSYLIMYYRHNQYLKHQNGRKNDQPPHPPIIHHYKTSYCHFLLLCIRYCIKHCSTAALLKDIPVAIRTLLLIYPLTPALKFTIWVILIFVFYVW